jgi:hypothetical protein
MKIYENMPPENEIKLIGYDAAGVVQHIGSDVS